MMGVPCRQLCWWAAPPPRDLPGDEVIMRCPGGVDDWRVVVVTDLWRTGVSTWQAAQAIREAGAQWVGAVALAKVVTRQEYEQSELARTESDVELAAQAHRAS
jgi:orotate phosphoribosyltransferase